MTEITTENLKKLSEHLKKLYFTSGRSGDFGVNISSEITMLIKEAAKCDSYASDLIYGIENVNNMIRNGNVGCEWFGFRDMGVDSWAFIKARLDDPKMYGDIRNTYRRIIVIMVGKDTEYYDDGICVGTYEYIF